MDLSGPPLWVIRVGPAREYVSSTLRAELLYFVPSQLVRAVGIEPTLLVGTAFCVPRDYSSATPHASAGEIALRDASSAVRASLLIPQLHEIGLKR